MAKVVKEGYRRLVEEIVGLYRAARKSLAEFYWGTGKMIVEHKDHGVDRATRGKSLLKRLSRDLTKQLGSGFSVTNLRRMRNIYLSHRKRPAPVVIDWTREVELLPMKDSKLRREIVRRAARARLSSRQIRDLVQRANDGVAPAKALAEIKVEVKKPKKLGPLKRPGDLRFGTYRRAEMPEGAEIFAGRGEGEWIDFGFYLRRWMPKAELKGVSVTDKPSFTYEAVLDRVVDGDTLYMVLNLGFGNADHWKLRLRGIDTSELGSAAGAKAKRCVEELLAPGTPLVVRSHKTDTFGRFVADVFFKPGAAGFAEIAASGTWLNQHLLDHGLAVRKAE